MKTCNNCSTENHIAAEKCIHCNMKGNFTYREMPEEAPQINESIIHCRNCANENPGNGIKCMHCNFPIQRNLKAKNTIPQIPVKANLRIS